MRFGHGTHRDHKRRMRAIREIERETGALVGTVADTQGTKFRFSTFTFFRRDCAGGGVLTAFLCRTVRFLPWRGMHPVAVMRKTIEKAEQVRSLVTVRVNEAFNGGYAAVFCWRVDCR